MDTFYKCKCGCNVFKKDEEGKIICIDHEHEIDVDKREKFGFFDMKNNKVHDAIINLGFEVGSKAAVAGVNLVIGVFAPWVLPFTITASEVVAEKSVDFLSSILKSKLFKEDTYGNQVYNIFQNELESVLRKGKRGNENYNSFYNYHVYCCLNYSEILFKLIDKNVNQDIYSEEAIRTIISDDEFNYPGRNDDPELINKVLRTAKEVRNEFENKVINDKNLGLRWLIQKFSAEHGEKLDIIIKLLESKYADDSIDNTLYEYIKNYNRPLFLDKKTGITLGKMYLDPVVIKDNFLHKSNGTAISAIDAVIDWLGSEASILMVYGAAGVGKTSFITKIINDICKVSENRSDIYIEKDQVHTIILREFINKIKEETSIDEYSALNVLTGILNLSKYKLNGHVIILDGLDELCVLSQDFDCNLFLEKLYDDLDSQNIKILITSRPMDKLGNPRRGISYFDIGWTQEHISNWCDKFCELTDSKEEKDWCSKFKDQYAELFSNDKDDNRLKMFSTPIILYLACKSNTIISNNDTIGEFYDKVFRKISDRKHASNQNAYSVYRRSKRDELIKKINWQYTKELAYQMFLNNTLILTNNNENGKNLIQYAKDRTISVLREHYKDIPDDIEIDSSLYFAVSYFASGNDQGIEFVHKTVYEYFTAVKLYEDYFADLNSEYFDNQDKSRQIKEVWKNIIEAFRYSRIPEEIFNYLNKMKLPAYYRTSEKTGGFDYNKFENCYVEGLKNHILSYIAISETVMEYKVDYFPINIQICIAFRNLTWFLSGHGFKNKQGLEECKEIDHFLTQYSSDINCNGWNLREADLSEVFLTGANFSNTDLSKAYLSEANIFGANLSGAKLWKANLSRANLIGADLGGANLSGADLNEADLSKANLCDADLSGADLSGANLRTPYLTQAKLKGAQYCLDESFKTIFPEEFDPKDHGMIEVDFWGNPV